VSAGGILVGEIGRFERQHPVFGQGFVLGMAAKIDGKGGCENLVAGLKAGYLLTGGFNLPGQFHPQDRAFGFAPLLLVAAHPAGRIPCKQWLSLSYRLHLLLNLVQD